MTGRLAAVRQLFFEFEGRIGRITFWAVQGPVLVLFGLYSQHVDPVLARWFPYSVFEGLTVALVLAAPLIWVQCAILAKRCHDRGKSGFWVLLLLIPGLGWLWLLVDCGLLPGALSRETPPDRSAQTAA
jgi:uncharacterized membrane protein YhaH (DUF805 family)